MVSFFFPKTRVIIRSTKENNTATEVRAMKKTLSVLISAFLLTTLAACSTPRNDETQSTAENSVSSTGTELKSTPEESSASGKSSTGSSGKSFDEIFGTEDSDPPGTDSNTDATEKTDRPESPSQQSGTEQPPQQPQQQENGQFPQRPGGDWGNGQQPFEQTGTTGESVTPELDTESLFSERDLLQTADTSSAKTIQAADNKTEIITEEGVYIITGTASDFTVKVEADSKAKVQLVLDGLNVTNTSSPVIYVSSADKCFITTAGSQSTLSVTGSFTADGDTKTDAVIFSKDDLVLNGTGTLVIKSSENGISGKDEIKLTGGTYKLTTTKDSIEANDSIAVYDGSFEINTSKDAFHSENDDDDSKGYIYVKNGSFNITASSDALQATTFVMIDGGSFTVTGSEGIEATYVQINGGDISITASDDGINASYKSRSCGTPTVEFNGGTTKIVMGQGDTDAVDANGNIIVNGGTIDVTATMSSFDYDGTAQYNGGTIIINGTQVDSIPQSMMGGGMGGRGNRGDFGRGNMMN